MGHFNFSYRPNNRLKNDSTNQSIDQSKVLKPPNQSINQSIDRSMVLEPANQSINKSISQTSRHSNNQSINQSINWVIWSFVLVVDFLRLVFPRSTRANVFRLFICTADGAGTGYKGLVEASAQSGRGNRFPAASGLRSTAVHYNGATQ